MTRRLLLFGPGYCGAALAEAPLAAGFAVVAASREPEQVALKADIRVIAFEAAAAELKDATHLVSTAPPSAAGDPVLARYAEAIAAVPRLRWIGYLSSTSVYGDRAGSVVDEETPPLPTSERGRARLAAERAWIAAAGGRPLDLFRLAGIYGPGRSAFDQLRAGNARRILAPGHVFCRIHRDDIVRAVQTAMQTPGACGRVFNLADEEPAESAAVLEEAARLLGIPPPPAISLAEAWPGLSAMARSFWQERRRVSSAATRALLGLDWRYPDFRAGLASILAEELDKG